MLGKPKVLFLSTGNSTRSQMAEGFLRALASDRFIAVSAGIQPTEVNPLTTEVMKEAGIDISHQKAKNVAESLQEHFAYMITMCNMAKERAPIFPSTPNLLHWSIVDPNAEKSAARQKDAFRRVRDEISAHVQDFLAEIREQRGPQQEPADSVLSSHSL